MDFDTLHELGWKPFFEQQVSFDEQILIAARVCAHFGSQIEFLTESGELSVPTALIELEGRFTATSGIAVGDWFLLDPADHHRAARQLERKTLLSRKAAGATVKPQLIAANVDTVFIVSSCNQEFNLSRLERYLALVLESNAVPVVVLTKADLCNDPADFRQRTERLRPGVIVEVLDARKRSQTKMLDAWCGLGQTVALLGSSGVGKSTLANAMSGSMLETGEVRADDDRGRHTTTSRSMHRLHAGGWLIDNPGMRELQLADCEQGVADLFEDIEELAQQCRFRDCSHHGDSGCAVQAAVDSGELELRRLNSYLKLLSEQSRNSASLAERRERDRKLGQLYKKTLASKRNRRYGN